MAHFVKGTYLKKKDGKLHIYIRSDTYKGKLRSKNFVGRTYIDKKQKVISSSTTNKKEAIKILEKWYDKLQFKKELGLGIHESSFKDCLKEFLKDINESQSRSPNTIRFIRQRFSVIEKCKDLMKLPVNNLKVDDINKHFLIWRMNRAKQQSKVLRGATIKGDLEFKFVSLASNASLATYNTSYDGTDNIVKIPKSHFIINEFPATYTHMFHNWF